jgi:hypothetical protein
MVPLALALVILCLPGALKRTSRIDAPSEEIVESVQDESPAPSEAVSAASGSGNDTFQDFSEALYKE